MTRRDVLKKMAPVVIGAGLGTGTLYAAADPKASSSTYKGKPMKVLLVNGSPHRDGCTYTALSEIAVELRRNGMESDFFWIGNQPVAGCIACGACNKTGRCFREDAVNEFLEKIDSYDGFIFGSPVHFASVAGAMLSFMDRAFYIGAIQQPRLAGKPGAAITTCRRAGSTATLDQMNKFITGNNMPMVPSQYWNMVHGNTPDEVRQDKEGLQIMRTLARNMAWMLNCFDAGHRNGIDFPVHEKWTLTNFIR